MVDCLFWIWSAWSLVGAQTSARSRQMFNGNPDTVHEIFTTTNNWAPERNEKAEDIRMLAFFDSLVKVYNSF
jgi:hypothetical protein